PVVEVAPPAPQVVKAKPLVATPQPVAKVTPDKPSAQKTQIFPPSINAITLEMHGIFAYSSPVRLEKLMTKQERLEYVQAMRLALTTEARQKIREFTYTRLGQRARELGLFVVTPTKPTDPEFRENRQERIEPREPTHIERATQELQWTIGYREPIHLAALMSQQERREYMYALQNARTVESRQ
ncbi:hypothetical protein TI03_07470, partial [Achromatium sp. WMS1]